MHPLVAINSDEAHCEQAIEQSSADRRQCDDDVSRELSRKVQRVEAAKLALHSHATQVRYWV